MIESPTLFITNNNIVIGFLSIVNKPLFPFLIRYVTWYRISFTLFATGYSFSVLNIIKIRCCTGPAMTM